jgi:hypothetical protein
MKITSILFLFLIPFTSTSQTFFKEKTILSTITTFGHEGPDDWGASFTIEEINFLSISGDTAYYKLDLHNNLFQLAEYDNKLFVSGSLELHFTYYDSTRHEIDDTAELSNYLLYDYNLVEGDTFWIADPFGYGFNTSWQRPQDSFLVIESVGKLLLLNGEETDLQIMRPNSYSWNPYNCKLLGSYLGALGHLNGFMGNMSGGYSSHTSLITACGNNEELMRPIKYYNTDVCDLDSLNKGYRHMLSTNNVTKESISIWPNPTTSKLSVNLPSPASYQITNQLGLVVSEGIAIKEIDVIALPCGMYYLRFNTGDGISVQKFVKH